MSIVPPLRAMFQAHKMLLGMGVCCHTKKPGCHCACSQTTLIRALRIVHEAGDESHSKLYFVADYAATFTEALYCTARLLSTLLTTYVCRAPQPPTRWRRQTPVEAMHEEWDERHLTVAYFARSDDYANAMCIAVHAQLTEVARRDKRLVRLRLVDLRVLDLRVPGLNVVLRAYTRDVCPGAGVGAHIMLLDIERAFSEDAVRLVYEVMGPLKMLDPAACGVTLQCMQQ